MKHLLATFLLTTMMVTLVPAAEASTVTTRTNATVVLAYNADLLGGLYNSETDEAASADVEDLVIPGEDGDKFYAGYTETFAGLEIDIDSALEGFNYLDFGSTGKYSVEYWNGSWTELSTDSSSYDLENTADGNFELNWDKPSDWETVSVDGSDEFYFVRLRITENYPDDGTGSEPNAEATELWILDSTIEIDPSTPITTDADGDGLSSLQEATHGTSDTDSDTDGDGAQDGTEVEMGTDPTDADDVLANYPDYEADCENPFDDTEGHWAQDSICMLEAAGVVEGIDGDFQPDRDITRAEFVKIALLNAELTITESGATDGYPDVSEDDWAYPFITYATSEGYLEGYEDGYFRPNDPISRAEATAILMRIAGEATLDDPATDSDFEDVQSSAWYSYAIQMAVDNDILEGYEEYGVDLFKPEANITRAEVAVIARRTWYVYYE